jgi:flagellar basal-body rod modification protein FlgD
VSAAAADFESFLTLLTAQLRNQDPLSPLDSTEFVAQLASFSSVEQQVQTNERLDLLTQQSLSGDIASFAGWIGRDIAATDGTFRATGGPITMSIPSVAGTDRIEASVVDASTGTVLRTFEVVPDAQGQAIWDGLDQSGFAISSRNLMIELGYVDGGTITTTAQAEVLRRVSGIRGTPDGIILDLTDGGTLAPDAVGRLSAVPSA